MYTVGIIWFQCRHAATISNQFTVTSQRAVVFPKARASSMGVCDVGLLPSTLRPRQNGRHFPEDILNGFSWTKMYEFRIKFHWNLFLGVQLTIFQHRCKWWLGADLATSHYLNQWWLFYWRIYASLGLSELECVIINYSQLPQLRTYLRG